MKPTYCKRTPFYLLLLLLLTFTACSTINSLSNSVSKPELSVSDASVTHLSLQDIELTFDIAINNPNPVAVNLADYNYDFQLNGQSFITGDQIEKTEIQASSSSTIQVPVRFGYRELYDLFTSLRDKDETSYDFLFEAGINAPVIGRLNVPIEKSGTLPVIKLPKLSIKNVALENLSLTKADVEVNLIIDNPNAFDLSFSNFNYNLSLNDTSPISGTMDQAIHINQKSESEVTVPISLSLLEMGAALQSVLRGGDDIEYSLEGSSTVDASLPLFSPSTFNFDRSGLVNIQR
ncbi:LEA14-like dessication related protein [Gracilimonas mengyeensis]|uniref:LEA14-like dessication related protein n=2 Tax=Gracilimonas mengyeensis TaxID=1302730 RepID=A0A521EGH2_9BACT|nr:LEA14-like dessication related protein [Gracilimonas mengyeensis]